MPDLRRPGGSVSEVPGWPSVTINIVQAMEFPPTRMNTSTSHLWSVPSLELPESDITVFVAERKQAVNLTNQCHANVSFEIETLPRV
jgi:hypothetical protein